MDNVYENVEQVKGFFGVYFLFEGGYWIFNIFIMTQQNYEFTAKADS